MRAVSELRSLDCQTGAASPASWGCFKNPGTFDARSVRVLESRKRVTSANYRRSSMNLRY